MDALNQALVRSIQKRFPLEIKYNGEKRVIEPHTFGQNSRGNDVVTAYQTNDNDGDTGWRVFLKEDIEDFMEIVDTNFEVREGYNPEDQSIQKIYEKI